MGKKNRQSIVSLALITAICLAGDAMLYIVLPIHWNGVGLNSLIEVGVLLSINRFVRLPLNPVVGFLYKKVPFRTGITLAVFLSGITTIGYGLASDFSIWVILRSLWGVAWSLFKLGAFLFIMHLSTDDNRGVNMGTYNGLYRLGSLVGMLIGGILVDLIGLKVISLFLGIAVFITIPFIYRYIPKSISGKENFPANSISSLNILSYVKNPTLVWMLVTAFLSVMILEGMMNATLSHLIGVKLQKEDIASLLISATAIAGGLQAIRWGILPFISNKVGQMLDRSARKNYILVLFMALNSVLLLIISFNIFFIFWLPMLLIHLVISSCTTNIIDTLYSNLSSRGENSVLLITLYTVVVDLGAALGPFLGYWLENLIGLTSLFLICSFVCLLLALKWFFNRYSNKSYSKRAQESL